MCFSCPKNIKSLTFKISGTLIVKVAFSAFHLAELVKQKFKRIIVFISLIQVCEDFSKKCDNILSADDIVPDNITILTDNMIKKADSLIRSADYIDVNLIPCYHLFYWNTSPNRFLPVSKRRKKLRVPNSQA
jgi:hypothetical protein